MSTPAQPPAEVTCLNCRHAQISAAEVNCRHQSHTGRTMARDLHVEGGDMHHVTGMEWTKFCGDFAKIQPPAKPDLLPCPFCGAAVKLVSTDQDFRHAGSIHWRTTIKTECKCFSEPWTRGDYGTAESIFADARRVWNARPATSTPSAVVVAHGDERAATHDLSPAKKPKGQVPVWLGPALARAMAEDIFNALTQQEKDVVEENLKARGVPPDWFIEKLTAAGLRLKNPITPV